MNYTSQEIRPRRIWYAVAAAVLGGGIVIFILLLVGFVNGLIGMPESMTRVVAPGTFTITLDKPGTYTIFDEYQSVVGGRVYSNPGGLGGLTCTLTDNATGRNIPITAASGSGAYNMGSYVGRSIFDFNIPSPGVYTLTAQYAPGTRASDSVLAIGHGFMENLMVLIVKMFAAVGTLVISILLGTLIFIVTIVRRSIAKTRLKDAAGM